MVYSVMSCIGNFGSVQIADEGPGALVPALALAEQCAGIHTGLVQSLQRFFKVLSSPGAVALLVDKLKSAGFFPLLLIDDHIERSGADGIHVGGAHCPCMH